MAGLYGKVLDELTDSLNFTLDIVSEVNEHGMWNGENRTWSGVMGEVVSGRADFAIADMSMTSLRIQYVDFTLPLIISRNSLFIKEPGICGVKWLGYFQVPQINKIALYKIVSRFIFSIFIFHFSISVPKIICTNVFYMLV